MVQRARLPTFTASRTRLTPSQGNVFFLFQFSMGSKLTFAFALSHLSSDSALANSVNNPEVLLNNKKHEIIKAFNAIILVKCIFVYYG